MPDDRFLHKRAGHSEKVNLLTDLEYRVWTQYLLSADDFGVMRGTHHKLQADNDHLSNRPARVIQRCIDALVACGLIRRFEHQGKPYVYQHDWQSWQKVSYPRTTDNPKPPAAALEACDQNTQGLFLLHPGGAGRTRREHSQNIPETLPENSPLMRASAPAKRLTANGLGERQEANGERLRPLVHRRRLDAAWEGPRVYVPQRCHSDFVALRNGAEAELFAWYAETSEAWTDGPFKASETGPDMFAFWKARYAEKWPVAKVDKRIPEWAR